MQEFFATTAKGMEALLFTELSRIPGVVEPRETRAGVYFKGELEAAYRVCLWSRIANRVLMPLKTFSAPTPEKLYGGVKSIKWSDHLSPRQTIAVDYAISKPGGRLDPASLTGIHHTHFSALKVKDAICDQLRSVTGERPSVDQVRPDVRINVYVAVKASDPGDARASAGPAPRRRQGAAPGLGARSAPAPAPQARAAAASPPEAEATVSIDLSGNSLHQRGYRLDGALAPLKENLAAAMLMLAGWPELAREAGSEAALVDPMCGSGTLPIEAAAMAANRAPGIGREHYGFTGWLGHVPAKWNRLLEEARDAEIRDRKKIARTVGYDRDGRAVSTAMANLERAKFASGAVHFEKREMERAEPIAPRGVIIANPPYGERLGEEEELKPLYRALGDLFKKKFSSWDAFVFTANPELAKSVGLKASRRHVLFNGALECRLLHYPVWTGSAG